MNPNFIKLLEMNKNFSKTLTTVTSCIISTQCSGDIIQDCIVALDSCATFDIANSKFVNEILEETVTRNISSFNGNHDVKFRQGIVLFNRNNKIQVNILPESGSFNIPTNCDMIFCRNTIDRLNIDINYHLKSKKLMNLKLTSKQPL